MGSEYDDVLPRMTLPDEYFAHRAGLSADDIEAIQDERLAREYSRAFERSAFYRDKFSAAGLNSDSVNGLRDLERLPFTTSEEVRPPRSDFYASERLMTVDQEQVSLIHRSSGTTGAPKVYPYTGRDVAQWAANTALVYWIHGFRKSDIVLGIIPFGEFTGGGGCYLGFIALGATYVPISIGPGLTEKVAAHLAGRLRVDGREISVDPIMRANAVMCLSSFLPRLEEILDEYNLRADDLALSKVSCGAEPASDALRVRFAERFGIWPRDNYGLGEFYGPGVAGECEVGGGLHVLSDAYIAEVIDPETGEPTPEGEMGELVLTSLCKDAMPLFRYRTGDRTTALPGPCPCGIAHKWIGRIPGRISADDLMIPGGVIVNRTYLENVLLQVDGAGSEYVVTVADHPTRKGLQRLYIAIEGDPDSGLAKTVARRVQVEYNAAPIVTVLPVGSIPRQQTKKARRILNPAEYWKVVDSNKPG